MINNEAIQLAKTILNIGDTTVLEALAPMVYEDAVGRTNNPAVSQLDGLMAFMLVQKYNTLVKSDGLVSQSLATVSETYMTEYSPDILKSLAGYAKVKTI